MSTQQQGGGGGGKQGVGKEKEGRSCKGEGRKEKERRRKEGVGKEKESKELEALLHLVENVGADHRRAISGPDGQIVLSFLQRVVVKLLPRVLAP
jgi:hypothetical protein